MQAHTYQCPNCGAYLTFDPDAQRWACPFCASTFERRQIEKDAPPAPEASAAQHSAAAQAPDGEAQVLYHCPSCGSQIVTSETTVATQCYYCHSPVVLQGRLTDEFRPDQVLPFTIDRDKAVHTFLDWTRKRRFVPKGFFSREQIETVAGVYYPHFVCDVDADGTLEGEGRTTSVVDSPKYITTYTKHFHVRREAELHFHSLLRPALSSADRKLSDGIHPFPLERAEAFSPAYLSGFMAERRDVSPEDVRAGVEREVSGYVQPLLSDDLHYDSLSVSAQARVRDVRQRCVLLPTWVLTYPNRRDKAHPFYYAMNGCTGEVCGKLPVDWKRLLLTAGLMAAGVFAALMTLFYFLF